MLKQRNIDHRWWSKRWLPTMGGPHKKKKKQQKLLYLHYKTKKFLVEYEDMELFLFMIEPLIQFFIFRFCWRFRHIFAICWFWSSFWPSDWLSFWPSCWLWTCVQGRWGPFRSSLTNYSIIQKQCQTLRNLWQNVWRKK